MESTSQGQMSLDDQKTHPSYLHLAAQIPFYDKGLPIPTSSCKVITSPQCLMLPLQYYFPASAARFLPQIVGLEMERAAVYQ